MVDSAQISVVRNDALNVFLALQREISGRLPWELCLLPRPHAPEVGDYAAGMRALREAGIIELPIDLVDVRSFVALSGDQSGAGRGWGLVQRSIAAVGPELRAALDFHAPPPEQAEAYVQRTLLGDEDRWVTILTAALGVAAADRPLPVYLVPFAPFPPGTAFLTGSGGVRAAYVDYRRFSGSTMLESLLTLLSWRMLTSSRDGTSLTRVIASRLPGADPATRRLRAILTKMLIAMMARQVVTHYEPGYAGTIETFGLDLRFPRLLSAIRTPWMHYLHGRTARGDALDLIISRLAARPAGWFVEQVDAASLAADFYLLEWLAAQGDGDANARLAAWQPRLAVEFVRHLDFAVGAELAHYDAIPMTTTLSAELMTFIRETCQENSLLRWPSLRRRAGCDAYRMAEAAFLGPGMEYGGEAWAPVARLMAQYANGMLSERVFIDQCFTLEHNNGCLFDKFYDTWDMHATLDAQARGDLATLGDRASAETRRIFGHYLSRKQPRHNALWSADPAAITAAPRRLAATPAAPRGPAATSRPGAAHLWPGPATVGCGSNIEPSEPGAPSSVTATRPLFRGTIRKSHGREVPELRSVRAVLHTDLGPLSLKLFPEVAPMAVGTFVQLARGEVSWRDPATGGMCAGPYYDNTRFHRIVPDFIIQGGDRTETGRGGPGFRYDEEPTTQRFDRPFLVGMVNTGIVTNGSQFFITLAEAPHLDGQYTIIGEVADDSSRDVARQLSAAGRAGRQDLRIKHVEVSAA
jgi:cyclophilin family peptidyl-prolyl cis-trans isomerase